MSGAVEDGMPIPYSFPSMETNTMSLGYTMTLLLNSITTRVELGEGTGSGWRFKKLIQCTFTAAFSATRHGLAKAIIGGKRRDKHLEPDDADDGFPVNEVLMIPVDPRTKGPRGKRGYRGKKVCSKEFIEESGDSSESSEDEEIAPPPRKRPRFPEITSSSEDDSQRPAAVVKPAVKPAVKKPQSAFILDECEHSSEDDGEEEEAEREEDRRMIDDEEISSEEYQPINYADYQQVECMPTDMEEEEGIDRVEEILFGEDDEEPEEKITYSKEDLEESLILLKDATASEKTLNLHTGVNLSGLEITPKIMKSWKTKMEKGIDSSKKPAGECSYFSLLGGLKLLKKQKVLNKHQRKRIKSVFLKYRDSLKNCPKGQYVILMIKINEEILEYCCQIKVYEESQKQNVVRIFDSSTRATKYAKNFVSFINRLYVPVVATKTVQPIHLYLKKEDKSGETECTFIKDMRAMQTILSSDRESGATTTKAPFFCHKCFSAYVKKERYTDHVLYCSGPSVEAYSFQNESHHQFDKYNCVDAPPFMIFFDVETRLVKETASLSTMYLVSYAIGVIFGDGIDLPMFTFYRSSHQTYKELKKFNIPSVIKSFMMKDDMTKCVQLASSIIAKKPYAINEMLFNDLFSIATACRGALYEL